MGSQKKRAENGIERFSAEFDGDYLVASRVDERIVDAVHGQIINSLARALRQRGIKAANRVAGLGNLKADIVIRRPVRAVIEAKSDCQWNDIFCAIGQLAVYSYKISPDGNGYRFAVVPYRTDKEKRRALSDAGIIVVSWRKTRSGHDFPGLDRALSSISR